MKKAVDNKYQKLLYFCNFNFIIRFLKKSEMRTAAARSSLAFSPFSFPGGVSTREGCDPWEEEDVKCLTICWIRDRRSERQGETSTLLQLMAGPSLLKSVKEPIQITKLIHMNEFYVKCTKKARSLS